MLSHAGVCVMRALAYLPLAWVRALGRLLGWTLYALAASRRRVVRVNLKLCFPQLPANTLRTMALATFVHFAQAWLDRGWLWHGSARVLRRRLQLRGAVDALQGDAPTVIFAPHFFGLDAGWTALTQQLPRRFTTIYGQPGGQDSRCLDSGRSAALRPAAAVCPRRWPQARHRGLAGRAAAVSAAGT